LVIDGGRRAVSPFGMSPRRSVAVRDEPYRFVGTRLDTLLEIVGFAHHATQAATSEPSRTRPQCSSSLNHSMTQDPNPSINAPMANHPILKFR